MHTTIWANDREIWRGMGEKDSHEYQFDLMLPGRIFIDVCGKKPFDTEVDESGKIVSDKHVLVRSMALDGIWVKKWMMESRIWLFRDTEGLEKFTNYFGTNGRGIFSIDHADILDFWLDCQVVD